MVYHWYTWWCVSMIRPCLNCCRPCWKFAWLNGRMTWRLVSKMCLNEFHFVWFSIPADTFCNYTFFVAEIPRYIKSNKIPAFSRKFFFFYAKWIHRGNRTATWILRCHCFTKLCNTWINPFWKILTKQNQFYFRAI